MTKTIVKVEKLSNNKFMPEYKSQGASGMDLYAAIEEPIVLKPLDRKLIPTGLKFELEKDFEVQIRPRSGLSIKHGITLINCIGTVDEDYRGEVCVPLVNLSNEEYIIQPNERIAQMVVAKVEKAEFKIVEKVSETVRGDGGFGSTGK